METEVHGSPRKLAEADGCWRTLKLGKTYMDTAIQAKKWRMNFRPHAPLPHVVLSELAIYLETEVRGSWRPPLPHAGAMDSRFECGGRTRGGRSILIAPLAQRLERLSYKP